MTRHLPLYTVVFLSGASVLAVEILGTRVLGPFYGVSLFLWSALITVTLAALSVGYVLGGRWADRDPRFSRLALVLAVAGVWLLAVPWLRGPILRMLESADLRVAVLVASAVLFFVPLALMGMVGPYAIRLRADRLEEVGRTAGDIYAISTVASVVAALLTGFVLIPNMGVQRLLLLVGGMLLFAALIAVLSGRKNPAHLSVVAVLLAGAGVLAWVTEERADPEAGLMAVRQSPYAELRVLDVGDQRLLLIDGGCHTIVERDTWRSFYPYVMVMDTMQLLFEEPGSLLVIGLGGGSLVKNYSQSGWSVDAVEIDPGVVSVAREYFGLASNEGNVIIEDGRRFLLDTEKTYDLIILDAFGSSSIPFHLVTREVFSLIRDRLAPGGVLAVNVESVGWDQPLVHAIGATLESVFADVTILPLAEPPNALGNVILVASDRPIDMDQERLGSPIDFVSDEYLHMTVVERNHAWANRFPPSNKMKTILTDDKNRVDLWSETVNFEDRKLLHTEIPWRRLSY